MNERTGAPTLLPMLRSEGQARVMTAVFLHPNGPHSIAEVAEVADVSGRVALIEVDRLMDAGLVTEQRRGRARLISPNHENPAVAPLTRLLEVTMGPEPLLREQLADAPGVDAAYIYGSWAERRLGKPGPSPGDIDVLVIGTADPDDLETLVRPLGARLGRTVSVTRIRPDRWQQGTSGFAATVRSKPSVALVGPDISEQAEARA